MDTPRDVYQELMFKAAKDDAFRAALLKDPKATLVAVFGAPLPDSLNVRVISNSANELTIVIPPKLSDELNEDDLAQVAGGVNQTRYLNGMFSLMTFGWGCIVSAIDGKGDIGTCREAFAADRRKS